MLRGAIRAQALAPRSILLGVDSRQVPGCGEREGRSEVWGEDIAVLGGGGG